MSKSLATPRSHCPISYALDIVGDRWTLLVLCDLLIKHKRHFHQLAAEEKIAPNILTDRLRVLQECGLITRRGDPDNARQVIYAPTDKGLDLLPVLFELVRWGAMHDPKTAAPKGTVERIAKQRDGMIAKLRMGHLKTRILTADSAPTSAAAGAPSRRRSR